MREIRTSGLMSEDGKRGDANLAQATASVLDSTLDPADTPEGHGNAGETADSRFHPSRPSGLGHLIWRKALAHQRKLVHEAARTPIHLGNPGWISTRGVEVHAFFATERRAAVCAPRIGPRAPKTPGDWRDGPDQARAARSGVGGRKRRDARPKFSA